MTAGLQSFFIGGFEASTMRRRDGRRNDLVAATRHDEFAEHDYRRLLALGISTVREGAAWHRLEPRRGAFDPSAVIERVRTAERLGIQVIWDLCHFGWPDDVDPFGPDFADRLAAFADWFAGLLREETGSIPWYAPVNEPSFVAWAGGDVEYLNPFQRGRGDELKRQLVAAALAASAAVRAVDPRARFLHIDPIIHIEPTPGSEESRTATARHNAAQFDAWDMLGGRREEDLGGSEAEFDVIGVNFYDRNQWVDNGPTLRRGDPGYRPLRELLADVHRRYRRPIVVAETGTEGDGRVEWLRTVCDEVAAARAAGIPVEGLCIYPVIDYPGWDDDRHVPVGLWGYATDDGSRPEYEPLIDEVRRQTRRFERPVVTPAAEEAELRGWRDAAGGVVLVTESREPSGMGRQMLTLARGLAERRRVILAAPDSLDARWLLAAGEAAGIETWPLTDGGPLAQAAMLRERLEDDAVDLVNVHAGIGWEGHAAAAAARAASVSAVVRTEHLPYLLTKPRDRQRYREALASVDAVIAVSHGVAGSHLAGGVSPALLHVVQNGIEEPQDVRPPRLVRQSLGVPEAAPLFATVGRLTRQKGYDVLLRAFAEVARARPDVRLALIGEGPLGDELDASITELGLDGQVRRLPAVNDVPSLLAASDALVLASRFEGLPLVALEAMALGRPVVGTRVCGLEETVEDGVTGRLVAAEDAAALAAAMLDILDRPAEGARFGFLGRRRYEARFRAQRMVAETDAVYDSLLGGAGAPQEMDQPFDGSVPPPLVTAR